jgi:hypothetical protein
MHAADACAQSPTGNVRPCCSGFKREEGYISSNKCSNDYIRTAESPKKCMLQSSRKQSGYSQCMTIYSVGGCEAGAADLLDEDFVSPLAHGHLLFCIRSLPTLVKGHHNHCCSMALHNGGVIDERFLAFLERDGVDDTFPLLHSLPLPTWRIHVPCYQHEGYTSPVTNMKESPGCCTSPPAHCVAQKSIVLNQANEEGLSRGPRTQSQCTPCHFSTQHASKHFTPDSMKKTNEEWDLNRLLALSYNGTCHRSKTAPGST